RGAPWLGRSILLLAAAAALASAGCRMRPAQARNEGPQVRRMFGRPGNHPGEMRSPRAVGVAPDGALIYVLDRAHRLQGFAAEGTYVRGWATPPGVNGNPRGLDVAQDGRIWVADTHNNQVVVYTPEGREVRRWGKRGTAPGELAVVTDVALDREGNVWTCQ